MALFYDWDKLVGTHYGHGVYEPFCLGADTGEGHCSVPPTETRGRMTLQYQKSLVERITAYTGLHYDRGNPGGFSWKVNDEQRNEISFVTIGDNNYTDCQHSDFSFDVRLKYVIGPEEGGL